MLLPYVRASVAVARQRLCAELLASGVIEPAIDDAAIVVSELLSNALRHARPLPSGQVQVAWSRRDGVLEVAVSDGGAVTEPRPTRPALSSLGGRGLRIVEALASRWGVNRADGATTVWAALPAPGPAAGNGHLALSWASSWRLPDMCGPRRSVSPSLPGPTRVPADGDYAMVRGGHRLVGHCLTAGGDRLRFSDLQLSDPQAFQHRQPW